MEDKEKSANAFKRRFDQSLKHGMGKKISLSVGVSDETRGRWGTKVAGYWRLPDIHEAHVTATVMGVSPAWLSFGIGGSNPFAEELGRKLALELESDPGLAHVVTGWLKANPEQRAIAQAWAKSICPPVDIKPLIEERARERAKPFSAGDASAPQPSSEPISGSQQLTTEEAQALKKWFGREVKSMKIEHPLTRAILKTAMLLMPGSALREPLPGRGKVRASRRPGADSAASAKAPAPPIDLQPVSASKVSEPNPPPLKS